MANSGATVKRRDKATVGHEQSTTQSVASSSVYARGADFFLGGFVRSFAAHPPPSPAKESPVNDSRVAKATTAARFADKKPKEAPAIVLDRRGVVVGADPRSITKAQALTASIARHKEALAADFSALGQDLAALRTKQLYRKVYGFATFAE